MLYLLANLNQRMADFFYQLGNSNFLNMPGSDFETVYGSGFSLFLDPGFL
jgi:hypothetical protein